ncbi:MAG: hypothetical protein ACTSWY_11725 [Promethearchaeota archaeon]
MNRNSIKEEFINIGRNMKILAILSIVHAIMIINSFGDFFDIYIFETNLEGPGATFNPFVLFFSIMNFISAISLFGSYFYFKKILNSTKKINDKYNSISLQSFNSYLLSSMLMNIIGLVGYCISISLFMWKSILRLTPTLFEQEILLINEFTQSLMLMLIGSFIGSILEIMAWAKLEEFFREYNKIFPESLSQDIILNSNKIKIASAFSLFELFSLFFIPFIGLGAIMGIIYYIKGYRNLGNSLIELEDPNVKLSEFTPETDKKGSITQSGLNLLNNKLDRVVEKIEKMSIKIDKIEGLVESSSGKAK